ncbi:hypothetical protein TNCV_2009361 [Trichonephila clavipes]|nr:hypothetical protein TNCV_2009361 [Trichonephila clavipes]
MEDRYSRLTEEARQARELCDAERRDCEDVVFVAKRNLRRLVERILEGQHRRKELGRSIERADEDARQEQRRRAQQRAMEEERLTRNVVLLLEKSLISVSKRHCSVNCAQQQGDMCCGLVWPDAFTNVVYLPVVLNA